MRPRSDTVARLFLDGCSVDGLAYYYRVDADEIEAALRRAFTSADRKRGRK